MASGIGAPARRLEIGRVAELTFGLAGRDFVVNYGIALAFGLLPALLSAFLAQGAAARVAVAGRPGLLGPGFFVVGLLNLLFSMLAYGAIIAGSVERLQGRNPTLRQRFAPAVRALPTLIGVALLGYIGLVIGFVLLIVPGLILAIMWIVVLPVALVETHNVFNCFSRSGALTKGHRWMIFLLLIVVWIGALIVGVASALLIHLALGIGGNPFLSQAVGPVAYVAMLLQLLVGAVIRVVFGTGLAALFEELRGLKGAFDATRLSRVFS